MKLLFKLTALAVCVACILSLASCADLGAGENEDDFKKYFSGVCVLSKTGAQKYSIEEFNRDISIEDTDIPVVVPFEEYCYIGFRVSDEYTVSLSEFAFFAMSQSGKGTLELEFYVVDKMPTSIKNDSGEDVEVPPLDGEDGEFSDENDQAGGTAEGDQTEGEGSEEETPKDTEDEIFDPLKKFHASTFSVDGEWDSVLLQFDGVRTVEAGQYVVVRINNNCYRPSDDDEAEETPSVTFTFNYLIFHFTDAQKK